MALFTLMVGIFIHPELVVERGIEQMGAAYLVLVATVGLTFSLQATYSDMRPVDAVVRLVLAAVSLYILVSFNDTLATILSIAVLATVGYWLMYRRKVEETGIEEVVIDREGGTRTSHGRQCVTRQYELNQHHAKGAPNCSLLTFAAPHQCV
jgi:hypothetical protein